MTPYPDLDWSAAAAPAGQKVFDQDQVKKREGRRRTRQGYMLKDYLWFSSDNEVGLKHDMSNETIMESVIFIEDFYDARKEANAILWQTDRVGCFFHPLLLRWIFGLVVTY